MDTSELRLPAKLLPFEHVEWCLHEVLSCLTTTETALERLQTKAGQEFDVACHLLAARNALEQAQAELDQMMRLDQVLTSQQTELAAFADTWDAAATAQRESLTTFAHEWDAAATEQARRVQHPTTPLLHPPTDGLALSA